MTALDLLDDGVVVLRTFSKLFGLAGARVGYALAARETADELNARQAPAPVSTLSAELAVAALAERPDPAPVIEERERLASSLRALGLAPLESHANFLYVPVDDGLGARRAPAATGHRRARLSGGDPRLGARRTGRRPARRGARARARSPCRRSLPAAVGAPGRCAPPPRRGSRRGIALDGASRVRVATGAGLYDHFLEQLAFHAGFDLVLEGAGDLETGDHHTAEDAALALGARARRRAR